MSLSPFDVLRRPRMARRYLNPAKASPPVTDEEGSAARTPLPLPGPAERSRGRQPAGRRLGIRIRGRRGRRTGSGPAPGGRRAAARRAGRARRPEGRRGEVGRRRPEVGRVRAAAASRDALAAAASEHLRSLAALATAAAGHNALLAEAHAKLAELGLRTRDDWLDEGQEHAEGTIDGGGVRAGGTDWTPVPAAGRLRTRAARCSPGWPGAPAGRGREVQLAGV